MMSQNKKDKFAKKCLTSFMSVWMALIIISGTIGVASAEDVQSVLPVADGVVRDGLYSPKDGIGDDVMERVVVQVLDVERDSLSFEDRGIIEFYVSEVSGSITNATLELSVFSSNGPYPFNIDVFTYAGDGILSLNDFNAGTLYRTFEYSGENTVQLDVTSFLQSIVSSGEQYAAFNFQFAEPSTIPLNGPYVAFNSLEYPPAAKLTIISESSIPVTVDLNPDFLKLNSNGEWINAYIEFPEGYDVNDIDSSTILLNDQVPAENKPTKVGDHDNNGVADIMVKFDRAAVQEVLKAGANEVIITGELIDGTLFEGTSTLTVI